MTIKFRVLNGYHNTRGTDAMIVRVYTSDGKPVFMGFEVREWSNDKRAWVGTKFSQTYIEALTFFLDHYTVKSLVSPVGFEIGVISLDEDEAGYISYTVNCRSCGKFYDDEPMTCNTADPFIKFLHKTGWAVGSGGFWYCQDCYPHNREVKYYDRIKAQLPYQTGKHALICPDCGKPASARVYGKTSQNHITGRSVKITCRHCGIFASFYWHGG